MGRKKRAKRARILCGIAWNVGQKYPRVLVFAAYAERPLEAKRTSKTFVQSAAAHWMKMQCSVETAERQSMTNKEEPNK